MIAREQWDTLHDTSPPEAFWSTSNFGEAMPGVMTPLAWSLWRDAGESGIRGGFYQLGVLSRAEQALPDDPAERVLGIFYGRVAGRVDFFARIGDRVPGTTGAAAAMRLVGSVPEGLVSQPTRRRYPFVAVKFPYAFLSINHRLRHTQNETHRWWATSVAGTQGLSLDAALHQFAQARRRFSTSVLLDGVHFLCAVQPIYEAIANLADRAGTTDAGSLMAGYGSHAESAVVNDLWAASRSRLGIDEVVSRHGYHGPREGELSAVVWREDDRPVRQLIKNYQAMPDASDPTAQEESRRQARIGLERQLLDALPRSRRASARMLLRLAASVVPMRGSAKAAFLQSFDMARAAVRRVGKCLAEEGILDAPDDVFFLTIDELLNPDPEASQLVAWRRERNEKYRGLSVPDAWQGQPQAVPVAGHGVQDDRDVIEGVGASAGVIEGVVRVVHDPTFMEVEPGEILVSATTDPRWASVMFVSKALVVDIGGVLSHAAVVARELGIPCVVNTRDATRVLRSGDYCRVDGTTGRVEVLKRASAEQGRALRTVAGGESGARRLDGEHAGASARAVTAQRGGNPQVDTVPPQDDDFEADTAADNTELRLLQAIRLKGRLSKDAAATSVGSKSDGLLERLAAADRITIGTIGAKLTPTGRERLTELLKLERQTINRDALSQLYEEFGTHNAALKAIVTAWQVRADGNPNDHSDKDYDAKVVARLVRACSDAAPLLKRIAEAVPRFDTYPTRLREALQRVGAGEHKWFANPTIDSYHQVWFELHEELIGALGLVREEEAKSGRA